MIGDSLIKHLERTSRFSVESCKNMGVLNAAMAGDKLENILYRIENMKFPDKVKKVYLAGGTNNLFSHTTEEIIDTLGRCVTVLKNKNPELEVYVQGLIARFFVGEDTVKKIEQINEQLREKFGQYFVDVRRVVGGEGGETQRKFFYRDGLHLSRRGNERLADIVEKIVGRQVSTTKNRTGNTWWIDFQDYDMCVNASIQGRPVRVLIDTGSCITLISKKLYKK